MGRQSPRGARREARSAFPPGDGEDVERLVRERCLALLTTRARSRAELHAALTRAGAPASVVERVLDRLADVRLVDDEAFAESYVRSGMQVRRRGRHALRAELRARGVDAEVGERALSEVDADEERTVALALARRRAVSTVGQPPPVRQRRLLGTLLRRGFAPAIAYDVVREVLGGEADEGAEAVEPAWSS